ncbi:hypothetical protein KP509_07G066000 [Ceratopteris richardii]|uniref:Uncharacterized protein n=1 Tax=Ceratopteris richardii TaxID=49495 RepID=A0A8T2UAS7_CERRI|nr:hypothetical protein KP509_07G066000 [Ceratopteris richardii]
MQFSIVLHILSIRNPIFYYSKWRVPLKFIGLLIQSFLTQYWMESLGWQFAKPMGEVIKSNLRKSLSNATFVAISLDEVTARDCTSWNIDTRWISLIGPIECLFEEYKSVIGVINIMSLSKGIQRGKAHNLLQMLSDVETLLYLGGMLPLLREMNNLIKVSQSSDIYVMEYVVARKMTQVIEWESLLQVGVDDSFSQCNKNGWLFIFVKTKKILFMYHEKVKEYALGKNVKQGLRSICIKLTSEIKERFPQDDLLEAMAMSLLTNDFKSKLRILSDYFGKNAYLGDRILEGTINPNLLKKSGIPGQTMWEQFDFIKDPSNRGAMTKLWKKLDISPFLKQSMSKYFKVANLCLTMILGSIEDEHLWSSLTFIRNATRNRLDKNLDRCLRLFIYKSVLENFLFEEAYAIWKNLCCKGS